MQIQLHLKCIYSQYIICSCCFSIQAAEEELQLLVQTLTKKVGEGEERYSLLQEQSDSLKELLATERVQYEQKENMYEQNVCLKALLSSSIIVFLSFFKSLFYCYVIYLFTFLHYILTTGM